MTGTPEAWVDLTVENVIVRQESIWDNGLSTWDNGKSTWDATQTTSTTWTDITEQ